MAATRVVEKGRIERYLARSAKRVLYEPVSMVRWSIWTTSPNLPLAEFITSTLSWIASSFDLVYERASANQYVWRFNMAKASSSRVS